MNPVHLHVMMVHLPVIGCMGVFILLLAAHWKKDEFLFKLSYSLLLFCTVSCVVAYYSGPAAYHFLEESAAPNFSEAEAEVHATVGQAAFAGMMVLGVAVLAAMFEFWQGEKPSSWHRRVILLLTFILCFVFIWAAHLGGQVRRPELRSTTIGSQ